MAWLPRKRREEDTDVERRTSDDRSNVRRSASWVGSGPLRSASARGLYRVFHAAEYRFYRALAPAVPPAEGDAAWATSTTLPATPSGTFADGTWYLSVSYFNGILDSGFLAVGPHGETYLTLTIAGGVVASTLPSSPIASPAPHLAVRAGGVIRILAYYLPVVDGANAATQWAIAYTTNGSTPAVSTPTLTRAMGSDSLQVLSYDLPAQANGTTVKVQLQVRRSDGVGGWIYSAAGTVLAAVADAAGPTAPLAASDS